VEQCIFIANSKYDEKIVKIRLVGGKMCRSDRCQLEGERTAYWGT